MKSEIIKLHQWALSHPKYVKPIHTAWQSFLGVFIAGVSPILGDILNHHYSDAKVAFYALIVSAIAAGLSILKTQLWPVIVSWSSSEQLHIIGPPPESASNQGT